MFAGVVNAAADLQLQRSSYFGSNLEEDRSWRRTCCRCVVVGVALWRSLRRAPVACRRLWRGISVDPLRDEEGAEDSSLSTACVI